MFTSKGIEVYGYRWIILLAFAAINTIGGIVYVVFTPLANEVIAFFAGRGEVVSTTSVSLLTLVNPLMYIFLALPFGILADKKGWRITVGIGAIFQAVFCVLRIFALDMGFLWLLIFQICFSIGGPPLLASVQKMVVKWFPVKERTVASGLGILTTFLGLMTGSIMSPILYLDFGGLPGALTVNGVLIVIGAIVFFALARETPPKPPAIEEKVTIKMGGMVRTRDLWLLAAGFFAGFGIYFSILTLAAFILPTIGIPGSVNAGLVTGCMTLGGILGCIVIPRMSDALGRRKPFLILAGLFAAVMSYLIGTIGILIVSVISALLLGFFVIAVLPVALEMLAEMKTIGPPLVGAASGLTMTIGYVGAVGVTLIAEMLGTPLNWSLSVLFLAILGLIGMAFMAPIKETGEAAKGKK
nr:MFS transporter [Candidatus Njordarchaeota archaeon]